MNIHREYGEHCARVKLGFEDSGSGITPYLPYLAGLGAAGIAGPLLYKHLRTVEPSTSKALNAMRAKANDTFTRVIPEKPARTRIGEWWDRLAQTGGDPIIYGDVPDSAIGRSKKVPGLIHYYHPNNQRQVRGDVVVGGTPEYKAVLDRVGDNKWKEYEFWNKHAPGSMGRSENIADILRTLGHKHKVNRTPEEEKLILNQLKQHLKQQYPKGFILKDVDGLQSSGIFPNDKTNFNAMLNKFRRSDLAHRMESVGTAGYLEQHHGGSYDDFLKTIRAHPAFEGRVLHDLMKDPRSVIVQEKLPLRQSKSSIRNFLSSVTGGKPNYEVRVHVDRSVAHPELAYGRYDPLLNVFDKDTVEGATAYAQSLVDQLPSKYRNMSWAMDITPLEDGSYRLLESNPGGQSGFIRPKLQPTSGIHLRKALLGNYAKPISAIGAGLGAAGAGTAAGLGTAAMLPAAPDPTRHG